MSDFNYSIIRRVTRSKGYSSSRGTLIMIGSPAARDQTTETWQSASEGRGHNTPQCAWRVQRESGGGGGGGRWRKGRCCSVEYYSSEVADARFNGSIGVHTISIQAQHTGAAFAYGYSTGRKAGGSKRVGRTLTLTLTLTLIL